MRVWYFIFILCLGLSALNCGAVKFSEVASTSASFPRSIASTSVSPTADILEVPCGSDLATIPIRILFVVDASGSNAHAYKSVPATDPKKTFRGGSISDFYNRYKKKENFSWGFEKFARDQTESLIHVVGNKMAFGNAEAMKAAIITFYKDKDGGPTPYLAALRSAYLTIVNDISTPSTSAYAPRYYIVFMSDGYPTDSNASKIIPAVASIVGLAPTRIMLSSVYYSTQFDPHAAVILKKMAAVGNGQFVNVNTISINNIAIQDLITLPTVSCR